MRQSKIKETCPYIKDYW